MKRVWLSLLLPLIVPGVPARAQEQPLVELRLLGQTTFVTPKQRIRLTVEATNRSTQPVGSLGMTLTIYHPARSRSVYRQAIQEEPPVAALLTSPFPIEGELAPGEARTLTIERPLPELAARGENALHPVRVQLLSDVFPVGELRTAVVFVLERPLVPLNVSFTFVLQERVGERPGGAFTDPGLERSIADGGRLEAIVGALERAPVQATIYVAPLLLERLDRMARGYRVVQPAGVRDVPAGSPEAERARVMLERIRALARSPFIEIGALPLASPSVPALVQARLLRDLESQIVRGHDLVASLLGVAPSAPLFRPPLGLLSAESGRALAELGVQGMVLDPGTLPPPAGLNLSPPATAPLSLGGGRSLPAITPDTGVASLLATRAADPDRQAQVIIGDLSAVYFEQPSVDRGIAVVLGEADAPDPALLGALLAALRKASPEVSPRSGWLRPVKASRLMGIEAEPSLARALTPRPQKELSPTFLAELGRSRRAIEQLESVTDQAGPLVERLKTLLLASESADLIDAEREALVFLRAVRRRVTMEFDKIRAPSGTSVTLTSRRGIIPVTLGNLAGYDLRIRVRLISPRLDFLGSDNGRIVVLDRPRQALTFPVLAQTTGRFPVRILVETPKGSRIAESRIVVRSTAYNTQALIATVAAALFLLMLWGRRFLTRRTP